MGAHSKTHLNVHLVWSPKYGKKVLTGEIASRVRVILREVAKRQKITIISGYIAPDCVHMYISFNPDQTISTIVCYLKGASAAILFREYPHLRKILREDSFWARGYFATTSENFVDQNIHTYADGMNEE